MISKELLRKKALTESMELTFCWNGFAIMFPGQPETDPSSEKYMPRFPLHVNAQKPPKTPNLLKLKAIHTGGPSGDVPASGYSPQNLAM